MHQNNISPNALDCFEGKKNNKKKMKELVKALGELGQNHSLGFVGGGFLRGLSLDKIFKRLTFYL